MAAMNIYLVLHHEIMGTPGDYRADEMVFFTCDSLENALKLIRRSHVSRCSWWEIQSHELNSIKWPEHVGYYGLRGGKLAKPPYEKCLAIYKEQSLDEHPDTPVE
jgi:hypothetical protein